MDEALMVFSRNGEFKNNIRARDISSREHARKLWPLVTQTLPHKLVTWVVPSFSGDGNLIRRSHFRTLPSSRYSPSKHFENEESERQRFIQESAEHRNAKQLIAAELSRRMKLGLAMPWFFKDVAASDFHLSGNLLLGANEIASEYEIKTSFGCAYRLDIAILAPPINREPIVLGGIEIEFGHAFEGRKALIGRSQNFPLISIDISDLSLDKITPQWAEKALTATTRSFESGERKTYVYLHDLLYPLYAQLPDFIDKEHKHQFLIFATDKELGELRKWLLILSERLVLPKDALNISKANTKSEQSKVMLKNAGDIVGPDWERTNNHRCLLVTINRPSPMDIKLHLFHIAMARLLLSHINALVGYKYERGILNEDLASDIWIKLKWDAERKAFDQYRVLPKRLAIPTNRLLEILQELN